MALIGKRKPFNLGGSKVISFPKSWTTLKDEVIISLDRVGLIIPKGLTLEEVKSDIEKLLRELERRRL